MWIVEFISVEGDMSHLHVRLSPVCRSSERVRGGEKVTIEWA